MTFTPKRPGGPIEGRDGIVEGRDAADVRPQPSVAHPPDDLTQLGTIGHDMQRSRAPRVVPAGAAPLFLVPCDSGAAQRLFAVAHAYTANDERGSTN